MLLTKFSFLIHVHVRVEILLSYLYITVYYGIKHLLLHQQDSLLS